MTSKWVALVAIFAFNVALIDATECTIANQATDCKNLLHHTYTQECSVQDGQTKGVCVCATGYGSENCDDCVEGYIGTVIPA